MALKVQPGLALLIGAVLLHSLALIAAAKPTLVAFGDSLTDTGNYLKLNKGTYPDAKWFKGGRSSGGGMWPEFVAKELKIAQKNFAYYGADACPAITKAAANATGLVRAPDGLAQVDAYLKTATSKDIKDNIHAVFLGSSDYITYVIAAGLGLVDPLKVPPPTADVIVPCVIKAAEKLLAKGATKVMFTEVPPFEIVPLLARATPFQKAFAAQTALVHANVLKAAVKALQVKYPKAKLVVAMSRQVTYSVIRQAKKYGFVNVTGTALILNKKLPQYPFIGPSGYAPNASAYLWFDYIHPTVRMHTILARYYSSLIKNAKWL